MPTTLKEQHRSKKIRSLQERLVKVDRVVLTEAQAIGRTIVLLEAMNEEDLQKVSGVIDKLRAIQKMAQNSGALGDVVDKALMDLQKITGGESSLGQKFLNVVGQGNNAKIFQNTMALVSALETGFRLMPQLLKNMLGGIKGGSDQSKKTVSQLLMGEGLVREAPGDDPTIETQPVGGRESENISKGSDKMELLIKNISKAMKPSKWWGLATGKIPYIDNPDALVTDMLNSVPVGNLMQIVQTFSGGPQASNLAQDVASGGGGETKGTEGSQQTSPAVGTGETGSEDSQKTGEPRAQVPRGRGSVSGEWVADFSNYLQQKSGVDRQSIDKIMALLVKNGKLREDRKILNSDAAMALLKNLAKSGRLTEAVEEGIVKIQLNESDARDLISK